VSGPSPSYRPFLPSDVSFSFLSEYGCNDPTPRAFDEVIALYGPQMTTLSGGLVYQYTQDTADYGLVQTYSNGTAQILGDYDTLMSQYKKIDVSLLSSSNSTATSLQPPQCNANLISNDGFSTDFNIPSPPNGVDQLIKSGVPNAPTGSIVSVTWTSVQVAVYATNGGRVSGLEIQAVSTANSPGQTQSGLSTGAASSATSSSGASTSSTSGSGSGSASSTGAAASAKASSGAFKIGAGFAGAAVAIGAGALAL